MAKRTAFIRLEFDARKAAQGLSDLERTQFPYAYAKSLTQVAQQAAEMVRLATRTEFRLHSDFIPKGIRIEPAKKADIQRGAGFARVYTAPLISGWMPLQETGGEKTPRGRALAIPAKGLQAKSYQTAAGAVKASLKPRALLAIMDNKGRRKKNGRIPFILHTKSGRALIAQRKGKGRFPLTYLYKFQSKADIKPRWNFEKTVNACVNDFFPVLFDRNLTLAMLSAKPEGT